MRLEKINDTTWKHTEKDNSEDRLEIIIGDDKQPDFKPQIKIQRWDNEVNASFRLIDDEGTSPIIKEDGKIKYIKLKKEVHLYNIEPSKELRDGGFEFEIVLKEKPNTNKFEFTIRTKNLKFYYQPPLLEEIEVGQNYNGQEIVKVTETDAYIKDGNGRLVSIIHRPERVVGSYAVYHESRRGDYSKSRGKNYRVGKVFHIYRPKIIDAKGNWTWGKLNVDEKKGVLTIEIDQDFLNKATYPVKIDPTFGYDVVGSSWAKLFSIYPSSPYYLRGSWFTCPDDGITESITAYLSGLVQDCGKTQYGIYKKSDNSLVGTTPSVQISDNTAGWIEISFTTQYNLEGNVDYWLVVASDQADFDTSPMIAYDSQDGKGGYHKDENTTFIDNFPDSWSGYTPEDRIYSIYCTYTEIGASSEYHINALLEKSSQVGCVFSSCLSKRPSKSFGFNLYLKETKYPNLKIYNNSFATFCYCSRWDEDNWNVTIEFIAGKSERDTILSNITPGAVAELYNILGEPKFIDTTYCSGNTLWIEPVAGWNLAQLRDPIKIGVKRYSETMLRWDLFKIKIEGVKL